MYLIDFLQFDETHQGFPTRKGSFLNLVVFWAGGFYTRVIDASFYPYDLAKNTQIHIFLTFEFWLCKFGGQGGTYFCCTLGLLSAPEVPKKHKTLKKVKCYTKLLFF